MQPLDPQPALIDRAYDRFVEAIADGTLAPGRRIRQEELGRALGYHGNRSATHCNCSSTKAGRGERPARTDRLRNRSRADPRALPGAQRRSMRWPRGLPPQRIAAGAVELCSGDGRRSEPSPPGWRSDRMPRCSAFIEADVAFHTALYRLSGNRAIEETVAAQWPHLKRSMGAVLDDPEQRPLVWAEHSEILRLVLAGDADGAECAARHHTARAGAETARRIAASEIEPSSIGRKIAMQLPGNSSTIR